MKTGIKCPERLAIYIERAFSKCISDSERHFMKQLLQLVCQMARNKGENFYLKQWEVLPLPCLQRESKWIFYSIFVQFHKKGLLTKFLLSFSGTQYSVINAQLIGVDQYQLPIFDPNYVAPTTPDNQNPQDSAPNKNQNNLQASTQDMDMY